MDTVTKASIIGIPVATLVIAAAVAAAYHGPSMAQSQNTPAPVVAQAAMDPPPPPAGQPPGPPPDYASPAPNYAPAPAYAGAPAAAPAAPAASFSQQELNQMLAPVALYPDPLLSQVLMAATYPMEVIEADRWLMAHPNLRGDAAVQAAQGNNWDPSVVSLVAFPQVLDMMDQRLD
ncbi:MAG TPA: DUF3300 domain-containing protein, partial [Burkholderiales bacterium]|nr:DUF3300 domain-containing protein [Burkholderiales bacterium]